MSENSKVLKCAKKCSHEFQDKRYGKNNRVHNYHYKKEEYECTVCKNTRKI